MTAPKRFLALSVPCLVLLAPPARAAERRLDLRVVRGAGADDCPDASALSSAVTRIAGHEVRADHLSASDVRVEVSFAHHDGRYVATLRAGGADSEGERTISHESTTCTSLAEAVAATLVIRLDDDSAAPSEEAGAAPALPPLPAPAPPAAPPPRPAAPDPDDIPPREHDLSAPHVATRTRWYGWQVLAADATSLAILVAATADSSPNHVLGTGVEVAGLAGYALGGAIVHAAHRRWWLAAASAGLHIGLPLLGGAIGATIANRNCNDLSGGGSFAEAIGTTVGCFDETLVDESAGGLLGMLLASSIDAALSWDRVPISKSDAVSRPSFGPIASVIPGPGGRTTAFVGLSGSM